MNKPIDTYLSAPLSVTVQQWRVPRLDCLLEESDHNQRILKPNLQYLDLPPPVPPNAHKLFSCL